MTNSLSMTKKLMFKIGLSFTVTSQLSPEPGLQLCQGLLHFMFSPGLRRGRPGGWIPTAVLFKGLEVEEFVSGRFVDRICLDLFYDHLPFIDDSPI